MVAASIEDMAAEIQRQQPAVVINTIGPFTTTAGPIARACLTGSHYVDLANDLPAVAALLDLDQQAVTAGKTLVTGAGFGVTATESVVVQLSQQLEGQQNNDAPVKVRVDMVPSLAMEAGVIGEALAGTILDGFPDARGRGRYEGRRYENGRLVRARIAGDPASLTLPDGTKVATASMPLGELIAAQRASRAPNVVSASSEAPSSPAIRAILPLATTLLAIAPVRAFARKRLAGVKLKSRERPREYSYGHARLEWAGRQRTGRLAATGRRAGLHRRRARRDHPPPAGRRGPPRRLHPGRSVRPLPGRGLRRPLPHPQRRHAHGTSMTEPLLNHK